ncbi:MAG TPA: DUF378 domain-containing protein [Candidatus Nanoarchaeia archaeon]|nr:DUF378 domain-containing protein [Candidatus Nanoarchaeia archaeon]
MHMIIKWIAWILVVIGALNWGLVGLFEFDIVNYFFGISTISMVIYDIIGLSALVLVVFKIIKLVGKKKK